MDRIDTSGGAGGAPQLRPVAPAAAQPAKAPAPAAPATGTPDLISLLADAAPPVDTKTVVAIRSLIATGAYPIDPHAIAAKMLALDFPGGGGDADA